MQFDYGSQAILTVGPQFDVETSTFEIVADFHRGISRLVQHEHLDGGSPAVREALQMLEQYLEYVRAAYQGAENLSVEELVGPPLIFNTEPRPGLEMDILNAMKLSLN